MKDTPYTDSLSEEIAQTVRGISCEEFNAFRCHATTYDEGDNVWTSWKEGKRNPNTNMWSVKLYTRYSGSDLEQAVRQQETTMQSVCFFDALYACAIYQLQQVGLGANVIEETKKTSHYADVAKSMKQPLDVEGMPHPAAFGDILTDGLFDDEAYDLAEQTQDVKIIPVSREQSTNKALSCLFDKQLPAPVSNTRNVISKDDKISLKAEFTKAVRQTEKLYGKLKHHDVFFLRSVEQRVRRLRKDIEKLPDCDLKFALKDFNDLAMPIERLRRVSQKVVRLEGASTQKLNKCMEQVIKAENELKKVDPDMFGGTHALRESLAIATFPCSGTFLEALKEKMKAIRTHQSEWEIPVSRWRPSYDP